MYRANGILLCLLPVVATIMFVVPAFFGFELGLVDSTIAKPLIRSTLVAATTSFFSGALGTIIGWLLFRANIIERTSVWLIFPFCLGSAAWTVFFLPLVRNLPGIETRPPLTVLASLVLVGTVQYAPLLAFITHASLRRSHSETWILSAAMKMTREEACELIYWPSLRPFFIFVLAVVFCGAFSDHEKALLYFRASEGTESALVPQAFDLIYRRLANVPDLAISTVMSTSLVVILTAAFSLAATLLGSDIVCSRIMKLLGGATTWRRSESRSKVSSLNIGRGVSVIAAIGLFLSIFYSMLASDDIIVAAILPVAISSMLSTVLYTVYMFSLRLSDSPLWGDREKTNRWAFVYSLLLIRLLPSSALFYIILSITVRAEHEADVIRWLAWFASHLLCNAVVTIPFMLLFLLRVRRSELECLRASAVSRADISRVSLLYRFWRDIVKVFVFVFVLIWNGDEANSAMSSVFQSVNIEIVNKLHGRSMDVGRVWELLIPTLSLALLAVSLLAQDRGPEGAKSVTLSDINPVIEGVG